MNEQHISNHIETLERLLATERAASPAEFKEGLASALALLKIFLVGLDRIATAADRLARGPSSL